VYKSWGSTAGESWYAVDPTGAPDSPPKVAERPEQLAQNLRFQGQYLDRETGLHYNTFRYFDADVGRFTTPDPIGLNGGINLHEYAPNPISWIDPWGWCNTKQFNKRDNITKRWLDTLSGKKPNEVANYLQKKGWTISHPQASTPNKTQHTVFTRTTKNGDTYILDHHPGGGIHEGAYWKIYKIENGNKQVFGRIGEPDFKNYDLITDSPVYIGGVRVNNPI
jgi:RHS repeat-associated protein